MGTRLLLDGHSIASEAELHDTIDEAARVVGLKGYGRNLDALWDVLTGFLEPPVEVRWINASVSRQVLGPRFEKLVRVFEDAEQELGRDFTFEMEE